MTDEMDNTGQSRGGYDYDGAAPSAKERVEATGEKFTKENAEYKKGKPFHRCGLCEYYRAHKCDLVAGYVEPMMGCKYFERD